MENMQYMRRSMWAGMWLIVVLSGAGCLASVQTVAMERVDQQPGSNRGYLVGTPPIAAPRDSTRDIAELQVVLPGPKVRGMRSEPASANAPPATFGPASSEETPPQGAGSVTTSEFYTVQKGDTLWSLARRFYGKGSVWPRIYDANRDQLSEPGRLRAGMRLYIPSGEVEPATDTPSSVMK